MSDLLIQKDRRNKDRRNDDIAKRLAVGGVAALSAISANAESVVDTTPIVTSINDTKPELVNVGTAMLGLVIVAVLFMMVRRVLR